MVWCCRINFWWSLCSHCWNYKDNHVCSRVDLSSHNLAKLKGISISVNAHSVILVTNCLCTFRASVLKIMNFGTWNCETAYDFWLQNIKMKVILKERNDRKNILGLKIEYNKKISIYLCAKDIHVCILFFRFTLFMVL